MRHLVVRWSKVEIVLATTAMDSFSLASRSPLDDTASKVPVSWDSLACGGAHRRWCGSAARLLRCRSTDTLLDPDVWFLAVDDHANEETGP
jgi:hypothetical protein